MTVTSPTLATALRKIAEAAKDMDSAAKLTLFVPR
jgi:hypothetical protein